MLNLIHDIRGLSKAAKVCFDCIGTHIHSHARVLQPLTQRLIEPGDRDEIGNFAGNRPNSGENLESALGNFGAIFFYPLGCCKEGYVSERMSAIRGARTSLDTLPNCIHSCFTGHWGTERTKTKDRHSPVPTPFLTFSATTKRKHDKVQHHQGRRNETYRSLHRWPPSGQLNSYY